RTADTQNRPANGRQSDIPGTPLGWRTVSGIRAGSSEMLDAARPNTTPCGLLKQPDKQKLLCCLDHTKMGYGGRVCGDNVRRVLPQPHLQSAPWTPRRLSSWTSGRSTL